MAKKQNPRTFVLKMLVNDKERNTILNKVVASGCISVSSWLRQLALGSVKKRQAR